jgi:hypothetical protein
MGSLPLARCRLGLSWVGWLVAIFAPCWLVLMGAPSVARGQSESADTIYPGDTVVVANDGVELGLRDKPAIVLKVGDKIHVTEIRGVWIGGHATVDGQRYTGWVHRREVRLAGTDPSGVTPIQAPSLPDDPDSCQRSRR